MTNPIERKLLGVIWDKPVPDLWLSFCPILLSICWLSLAVSTEFIFHKIVTNQLFGWDFCLVQLETVNHHQVKEQVIFASSDYWSAPETAKTQPFYHWLTLESFQQNFDKIYFYDQLSQPLYDVMQSELENLEFVQGVNFEITDSLNSKGAKYVMILDDSIEKTCNSRFCWYCYRRKTSWTE